jgi:3D (Asp-Asp-Asp) domain-containing protein
MKITHILLAAVMVIGFPSPLTEQMQKGKEPVKIDVQTIAERHVSSIAVKSESISEIHKASRKKGRFITLKATAYTARCKGCTGITATGLDIRHSTPKIVATDPRIIPMGTKLELFHNGKSLGVYRAADKGGAIKGHRIDILVKTNRQAREFGRRTVQARIIR